jgi:hypothetical protein
MTKTIILRNVVAIVICLAAATTGANAQLGGALRKAADAAKKEVQNEAKSEVQQTSTQAASAAGVETPAVAGSTQATGSSASRPAAAPKQPWAVDENQQGTIQATFADGVLTFKGAGEMFDFKVTMYNDNRPWAAHVKEITSAVVEEGITHLSAFAFYGCENLASVSLPATLINIRGAAFFGCKSLPTIELPAKLDIFSSSSVPDGKGGEFMTGFFGQCPALTEIKVAAGNEKYKSVDGVLYHRINSAQTTWRLAAYPAGRTNTSFNVPEQTPVILVGAFADCANLQTVVLPQSCGEIQTAGFRDCTALESITLKSTRVTRLSGHYVFQGVDMSKIKINVPKALLEDYVTGRSDSEWKKFASQFTGQ